MHQSRHHRAMTESARQQAQIEARRGRLIDERHRRRVDGDRRAGVRHGRAGRIEDLDRRGVEVGPFGTGPGQIAREVVAVDERSGQGRMVRIDARVDDRHDNPSAVGDLLRLAHLDHAERRLADVPRPDLSSEVGDDSARQRIQNLDGRRAQLRAGADFRDDRRAVDVEVDDVRIGTDLVHQLVAVDVELITADRVVMLPGHRPAHEEDAVVVEIDRLDDRQAVTARDRRHPVGRRTENELRRIGRSVPVVLAIAIATVVGPQHRREQ